MQSCLLKNSSETTLILDKNILRTLIYSLYANAYVLIIDAVLRYMYSDSRYIIYHFSTQ